MKSLIGSVWRDSNGHTLTVTGVEKSEEHEKTYYLYGDLGNCTCPGFWGEVHTSPDEYPDYHNEWHAVLEGSVRRKHIFGWDRIA